MTDRKIVDYIVVGGEGVQVAFLREDILKKIKEGWQPFGTLCVFDRSPNGTVTNVIQPMVKYEEKEA